MRNAALLLTVIVFALAIGESEHKQKKKKAGKQEPQEDGETDAEVCKDEYRRYSDQHIGCLGPNPNCRIAYSGVTDTDKETILKTHNDVREQVASGQLVGEDGKLLPPATNIIRLVWDTELERMAQNWAGQCKVVASCLRCRGLDDYGVGQIVMGTPCYIKANSSTAFKPNWKTVFNYLIVSQSEYFSEDNIVFKYEDALQNTGYLTQMIWAETWRIGCGYIVSENTTRKNKYMKTYVCNYGPKGNLRNMSAYIVANETSKCSGCPMNSCCGPDCSDNYPSLCTIDDDNGDPKDLPKYLTSPPKLYCTISMENNCSYEVIGVDNWERVLAHSDPFLRTILNGGETTALAFNDPVLSRDSDKGCIMLTVRQGPNVYGTPDTLQVNVILMDESGNELPLFQSITKKGKIGNKFRREKVDLSLKGQYPFEEYLKINLTNPPGSPPQFFDLNEVYSYDNRACYEKILDSNISWTRFQKFGFF